MIINQIQKPGATLGGDRTHDIDFKYAEFDEFVPYLGGTWKYRSQRRGCKEV